MEGVRHLLGVTACSIWLIDPETDELVCRQAAGPSSEIMRGWRLAVGQGLAGWVASRGESRVVPDIRADERFVEGIGQKRAGQIRSILCVPLRTKRGVIGVIYVADTQVNCYGVTDLNWVEALAAAAASAIENAQLHTQIRKLAAEQERERLARALHDTVTQSLYSIGMAAQTSLKLLRQDPLDCRAINAIEHILALSQTTLSEMREQLYELHPTALADRGLTEALAQHCSRLRTQYLLSIKFKADREPLLSMTQQEALYYIAREALWNIVKYAAATRVNVALTADDKQVILSVVDDGTGFDPSIFLRQETMGLRNMKRRAELLGGTFELDSRPGHGTCITARVPLQSSASTDPQSG
jgi:signal transduction histidine kinase